MPIAQHAVYFIAEIVLKSTAVACFKLHRDLTVTYSEIGNKNIPLSVESKLVRDCKAVGRARTHFAGLKSRWVDLPALEVGRQERCLNEKPASAERLNLKLVLKMKALSACGQSSGIKLGHPNNSA